MFVHTMYIYQKTNRYFAQVADDIKEIAAAEIQDLGATEVRLAYRGLYFEASPDVLYCLNLRSALVHRILAPLLTFDCHSDRYLYKTAAKIQWSDFLTPDHTFAVFATVSNSTIRHSKFAALRLKDAIVDYFRATTGKRPSIETQSPDLWINLRIHNNRATLSIDTSSGSLHRRRYRLQTVEAPMIETLAAAILKAAEWDCHQPLYDPFCGSGTLLCEAYLQATQTPPGMLRSHFGFERLPDFDLRQWEQVKQACSQNTITISKNLVAGSDISKTAVAAARRNANTFDQHGNITIHQRDIFQIDKLEQKFILCNPPYGVRLKNSQEDLATFYKRLGDFLKQRCRGSTACIYFGDRQYIKHIGLRSSWKKPFSNGGLDGRLVKYVLY
ncbi:MAG: THUMP domain-containing protein [Candidatus Poribacteria bacterium]|nr:THUMP domain-containing protein [Candidatus Poribacteria bacterium]